MKIKSEGGSNVGRPKKTELTAENKKFAEILAEALKASNATQTYIAELIGVTQPYVAQLLKFPSKLSALKESKIEKLCDLAGFPKAQFIRISANANTARGSVPPLLYFEVLPSLFSDYRGDLYSKQITISDLVPPRKVAINFAVELISNRGTINLKKLGTEIRLRAISDDKIKSSGLEKLQTDRKIHNGQIFSMASPPVLTDEHTCEIEGGLTDYFSTVVTHQSLQDEYLTNLFGNGSSDTQKLTDYFNLSTNAERHLYCGIGCTTVVCYKDLDGEYKIPFKMRSKKVASHAGFRTPLPASMFECISSDLEHDWNIQHQVIRAFCEELFSKSFDRKKNSSRYIYNEWSEASELQKLLFNGGAKLLHAGIIRSRLNWRYEIVCALLIQDEDWMRKHGVAMALNWESVSFDESVIDRTPPLSLDRCENDVFRMSGLKNNVSENLGLRLHQRWSPTGFPALWLGVDAFREFLEVKKDSNGNFIRPDHADRNPTSPINKLLGLS